MVIRVTKSCMYKTRHYNLWPAVIVLPEEDGVIFQLKFWNRHLGVKLCLQDVTTCWPSLRTHTR